MEENEMKAPKVTIGMPVYNGELFIRKALDSLLEQTFTDFELIISDNASTDETKNICREYEEKDSRIRYVRQAENRGAIENFQFVLDEAVGEYFMWAAADDFWGSEFLINCLAVLEKNCQAVAAIANSKFGDNKSSDAGCRPLNSKYSFLRRLRFLWKPGPNARFYSLYRRVDLNKYPISNYNFHAGDWAFIFDLLQIGTFETVLEYEGFFKRDGGAGSKPGNHQSLSLFEVLKKWLPLRHLIMFCFKNRPLACVAYMPLLIRLNLNNARYLRKLPCQVDS